jgi:hypothetical protein
MMAKQAFRIEKKHIIGEKDVVNFCTSALHIINYIESLSNIRLKREYALVLFDYLRENNIWYVTCQKNNKWISFATTFVKKIKRCYRVDPVLYNKALSITNVRLCKFCCCYTIHENTLCSRHILYCLILRREGMSNDLIDLIMLFYGVFDHYH